MQTNEWLFSSQRLRSAVGLCRVTRYRKVWTRTTSATVCSSLRGTREQQSWYACELLFAGGSHDPLQLESCGVAKQSAPSQIDTANNILYVKGRRYLKLEALVPDTDKQAS